MKIFEKYGKVIAMSAAALGMTAALTVESSLAYFTTYVSSGGGGTISLGTSSAIHEDPVVNMTKKIMVENTSENECFVRVKIFSGDIIGYEPAEANGWSAGDDGYWYYSEPLEGKEPDAESGPMTGLLDVKVIVPEGFDRDDFNVVVVQECVPVFYDDDGNPYADWNVGKGDTD